MRAIIINNYGGSDMLELADRPVPTAGSGETLVQIKAAAVNPADGKWRSGMFSSFIPLTFPHILGYDIAGIVADGDGFAKGTRVAGMLDPMTKGGYAEYAAILSKSLAAIPDSVSFETAASIPTAGLTGTQMVERAVDVQSGQLILITGAVGAVGRFAVYWAKQRGAEVVAAVRAAHKERARAEGADHAIALGEEEWTGRPLDHVIDTIGGDAVAALCRHLAPGGKIVTAATTPIDPAGLTATPEFFSVTPSGEDMARLLKIVADGEVEVPVTRILPLERAAEAQELTDAGGAGGKIVLTP